MNIALVLQHKLLLGIQGLFHKLSLAGLQQHSLPRATTARAPLPSRQGLAGAPMRSFALAMQGAGARPAAKVMPLRVLRVVEQDMPRSSAGRLVISGRMADVCAELDRLVEREAALQ